ncbi:Phosphoribomutase [Penicillium macrosclerotiorum]|uniref:Phosphoribomutase n=1 Tax=Penicillium macrosclerotiorum TaxID=303699 RepID=UPI00254824CB|nr:Phosphoribomutase [Penicillium macrosclerotiorum]KAJ5692446.1 Phosphoribomutase [Penicillium macrosclerotiorum]
MADQVSLSSLVETWLRWDQDPATRAEIEQLRNADSINILELILRKRIEFGTAGLRGRMAAGFSYMNCLTVIQASQGLAKYIRTKRPEIASRGVIIGHDARHHSHRFAQLAANAFISQKIPVRFIDEPAPTPFVSFGVREFNTAAGVVVTASHNPPQDNGYKVYSSNGAQINRPEDGEIAQSILENLEPWLNAWAESQQPGDLFDDNALVKVLRPYQRQVKEYAMSTVSQPYTPRSFVYTPLHGVGGLRLSPLLNDLGIYEGKEYFTVPRQSSPDPNFSTVKFPNPEEAGALDLAIETADKVGQTLIFANDPDADRFAVAEKVEGKWFLFTGNHTGVLLASHLFDALDVNADTSKITVLTTTVSSGMLEKMATAKGIQFEETLTGFKWMGNIAQDLEKAGQTVPFAYEEALGYMFPAISYDKDGITALAVFSMAAAKWRSQGLTVFDKLQSLFVEYGHHETLNNYFRSPNPQLTLELFRGIRSGPFLAEMQLGAFKILRWRDLTEGYDSETPDHMPDLPKDPTSQMLTLWLEGGVRFTFRGSGTEPKVKFYIECCGKSQNDAVKAVCHVFLAIMTEWVQRYTPSMTHNNELSTSSGSIFRVEK